MSERTSVFGTLSAINVNDKTEKKNGLTYLSWAWAWSVVKAHYPDATFAIYERTTEYGPVNYFTDGRTCWVKTGVTIEGLEHIEDLPVMDYKNNAIPYERVTSTDVNKAIQRSLTKAAARHGLGLYIYAGEDLPEGETDPEAFTRPDVKETTTRADVKEVASVTTVEKLPKEKKPTKPVNEVTGYLLAQMGALRDNRGISASENNKLFKAQREALIAAKLAPDKPLEEYTMDEAEELINAMYKCFSPKGTELKTE